MVCLDKASKDVAVQAIYHGKPIVAMPFFGDQLNNADKMVSRVGHGSPHLTLCSMLLNSIVLEILSSCVHIAKGTTTFEGVRPGMVRECIVPVLISRSRCRPELHTHAGHGRED